MLPQDNMILLSYINTLLRDKYSTLADLCDDLDENEDDIVRRLDGIGYRYDEQLNRFV